MGILSVIAHIVCLGLFAYAAVHDIRTRTIPNWCNIAIAAVGLVAWLLGLDIPANGGVVLGDRLMGAVLCGGPFLLATLGGAAIGAGDGKFLAAAGFVLGMRYGFAGLAVGVLAAGAHALYKKNVEGASGDTTFAFGPYLAAGMALALLAGPVLF